MEADRAPLGQRAADDLRALDRTPIDSTRSGRISPPPTGRIGTTSTVTGRRSCGCGVA